MPLPEVHILKQRIGTLIKSRDTRAAPRAIESFMNRLRSLHNCIDQLPFDDRNAVTSVMYTRLERVLMRFEELEWLGPQSGPVTDRHIMSEAIHAYGVRSDRIDDRLEQLSIVERLATAAVMYRELQGVLMLFEQHELLRRRRFQRFFTPPARWRWN